MNTPTKEHTMSKQVHIPHTDCDHPKTPKARAVCRRLRRAGAPETSKQEIVTRDLVTEIEADMTDAELDRLRKLEEDGHDVHVVDVQDDDVEWVNDEDGHYDIVTANEYPNSIDNEDEIPVREVPSPMHGKDATLTIIPTIQAKGSKVVHVRDVATSDAGMSFIFACTKRVAKNDAQRGVVESAHLITCKNCLKLINK
jgi:hypothetical protein